jgi:hypothetical protein
MRKIPIQDQTVEVSEIQFFQFLKVWVDGIKAHDTGWISLHSSGLADFAGTYYPKMFTAIKVQAQILESEIQNPEILLWLHELLTLTEKVWNSEQEIVLEYSKTVHLDISEENNRKKLKSKVNKYCFGDISKGTNLYVPEAILKTRHKSMSLLPPLLKISAKLDAEIEKSLALLSAQDLSSN